MTPSTRRRRGRGPRGSLARAAAAATARRGAVLALALSAAALASGGTARGQGGDGSGRGYGEAGPPAPQPGLADAAAKKPSRWRLRAYWENDGSLLKRNHGHDRHYTNGVEVALVGKPKVAADLAAAMPDRSYFAATDTAGGLVLTQKIFTPMDLTLDPPDPSDRPYAGYLYLGGFAERANAHTLDHAQLDIGVVGPSSLARQAQEIVHHAVSATDPQGWEHQLKDEPAVQLTLRRKWRVDLLGLAGRAFGAKDTGSDGADAFEASDDPRARAGPGVELIPDVALGVGTVRRYVEAGAMIRGGWNLPDDFGPGRIGNVSSATGLGHGPAGWSFYGFCRVAGRASEHNTFIQGSSLRSGPGVDALPLTGELWGGVSLAYRGPAWTVSLTYSEVFFTKQFESQDQDDSFGAAYLSIGRRF